MAKARRKQRKQVSIQFTIKSASSSDVVVLKQFNDDIKMLDGVNCED